MIEVHYIHTYMKLSDDEQNQYFFLKAKLFGTFLFPVLCARDRQTDLGGSLFCQHSLISEPQLWKTLAEQTWGMETKADPWLWHSYAFETSVVCLLLGIYEQISACQREVPTTDQRDDSILKDNFDEAVFIELPQMSMGNLQVTKEVSPWNWQLLATFESSLGRRALYTAS